MSISYIKEFGISLSTVKRNVRFQINLKMYVKLIISLDSCLVKH